MTPAASTTNATANGLNQISGQNGTNFTHDANGNLLSDGTRTYQYRSDNRLSHGNGNLLRYDPLDRLDHSWYNNDGFDYDGHKLIVQRSGSTGPVYERYVHGPGADEPLTAIAANGSNRRFLHSDERGSIVAVEASDAEPQPPGTAHGLTLAALAGVRASEFRGAGLRPMRGRSQGTRRPSS